MFVCHFRTVRTFCTIFDSVHAKNLIIYRHIDHKKIFLWATPPTNHHFFYLWSKPLSAWLTSRQGPIHGELPVTAIFWSLPLFLTPLSQAQYLTAPIYEGVQMWPSTKKLKAKMKLKWHHLMLTSSHCSCMYVKVYLCFAFVWQYLFFGVWYFDYKWMNESGFEFLVVGQGEAVHCPGTIRKYNSSKNRRQTQKSYFDFQKTQIPDLKN